MLARPQFTRLEDRLTPAVVSSLVGSVATVTSDAAADAINITEAAGFLLLNGSFDWDTGTLGIQFLAAANSSTINLDTGAGADTVNVGDTGASPASLNLARINYNSGGAGDQLHVFDNGNASANKYTYNTSTFVATGIDMNVGGTAVTGGRFLVTGQAADTVLVQSVFGGEACTVDSAAGNDTVTVGTAAGGMGSINAQVEIQNNTVADFTVLNLEDSADTTADIVNISNGALVTIAGLADGGGSIVYDPVDVQIVTINAGSGGGTFNVAPLNEVLNLNAGAGSDSLNLVATGTTGALNATGPLAGDWDWSGFGSINYTGLDVLSTDGTVDVPLTMTGTNTGDFMRLSRPGTGTNLRVSAGGQTWIQIPFAQVDDTLTVNGNGGDDRLEVDQGTDLTINRVINYNGGTGDDSLLMNGTLTGASSGAYNPGAADANGFSGQVIENDAAAASCIVNFTGLSPVEDLTVVANYAIAAFAGADTINIVNGPLSSGADPVTGLQENTIEVNFGGAAELVRFRNKTNVGVDGKAGADKVTVNVTTTGTGLSSLVVDTGDGDDSVFVHATDASYATTITSTVSSGGVVPTDTVTIGDASSVQGINGNVTVRNPPALSTLIIDDSADTTGRAATLNSGSLKGFAPATINWFQSDLNSLAINGGSGGNSFTVNNTPSSIFGTGVTTTLTSGSGTDTVNVLGTAGTNGAKLDIEGNGGADVVTVGSLAPALGGTLANINGPVTIRNSPAFSSVVIDDSGDAVARNATIDTVTIGTQLFGRVNGLGNPAAIQYAIANSGDVLDVNVYGGSGGNTYTIDQTGSLASPTFSLHMGTGSDTATITPDQNVTYSVFGDTPAPPTLPGDTLNVLLAGASDPALSSTTTASGKQGSYTFSNRQNIDFQELETLSQTAADLAITIDDGATSAIPGTKVTYTIVATNTGPLAVNGASITDSLPAELTGVTFTAVQSGGATGFTAAGNGAIGDTVNMPVGSTITYTVTGTISSAATANLLVSADIAVPAVNNDPTPGNNHAQDTNTLTPKADLGVVKLDTPDPVLVGGNITYTITVTNNGPSDALLLSLNENVPANTTFVSFTAPAGWATTTPPVGGTGFIQATRPSLATGNGAVFTLVVRVNTNTLPGTSISNTAAFFSGVTPDQVPGNDGSTASTLVGARPLPIVVGADAGGGPHVIVYDQTGAVQFSFYAYAANFKGGVRVAAGDVTGDGVPDIVTAAGPGGGPHVKVFDGVTGTEVRSFFAYVSTFTGGVFVAAADVDNDGFADIITGADAGGGPHVQVFSGKDNSVLYSFFVYDASFRGGVRVAGGDVDGDHKADIITGAGAGGGPHVKVFSGDNGVILRTFFAFDPSFLGGVYVSAADINNDSKADLIVGAGAGSNPTVKVFNGTTLATLKSFDAYAASFAGGVRVGVADANGDGRLDLLTGAGPGGGPHVQAFDTTSFSSIRSFYAFDPGFLGGVNVG